MGFCPVCRSEFVTGIERCAECDQALLHELPGPIAPPADPQVEAVYESSDPLEANLVRETLLAEGVDAVVLGLENTAFPTQASKGYEIVVPRVQAERARALIEEAIAGQLFGGLGETTEPEPSEL